MMVLRINNVEGMLLHYVACKEAGITQYGFLDATDIDTAISDYKKALKSTREDHERILKQIREKITGQTIP
jgi:CBS-domain-containing membrane protein